MLDKQRRRAFRSVVWVTRAAGWALITLAILDIVTIGVPVRVAGGFGLLASVALGVLGIIWVVGLELFLRFFDQYLSRN